MNLLNDGNGSFHGKFVKFARNSTIYSETSRLKNPRWNRFDRNFFFFFNRNDGTQRESVSHDS